MTQEEKETFVRLHGWKYVTIPGRYASDITVWFNSESNNFYPVVDDVLIEEFNIDPERDYDA